MATIIAEGTAQVLIQNTINLFTPAQKIDEVQVSVRDLRCFLIPDKVIFQGALHKQIFFVDAGGVMVHQGADIPFSGFLDLPGVQPGQCCVLTPTVVFVEDNLAAPDVLRETAVVDISVQVSDGICPQMGGLCCNGRNGIRIFPGNQRAFSAKERGMTSFTAGCR